MEQTKKDWIVFNKTDGILASPDYFTEQEADDYIKQFPARYKYAGYYLTGMGERIDPTKVILEKHQVPVRGKTAGATAKQEL